MKTEIQKCPFCSSDLEKGCVLGNSSMTGGFRRFEGEPSLKKNIFGSFMAASQELGRFDLFSGPYLLGFRCTKCKKVILDY